MDSRNILPPKFRLKPLKAPSKIPRTYGKDDKDDKSLGNEKILHASLNGGLSGPRDVSTMGLILASETSHLGSSLAPKSPLGQPSKRLKRGLEIPSCGLPSPASTASYISNYTSPSISSSFTKRLRLTYKAPKDDDYNSTYSTLALTKNTSSYETAQGSASFRQYASVGDKILRPKLVDDISEGGGLSSDTKFRALQMIQWALSCNTNLRNEYTPTFILGWGGCGAVFEAERKVDGEKVAIKIMYKSSKRSGVPNEINILSSLCHQNIVSYHDYFEDRKANYLVMERFGKIWKSASSSSNSKEQEPILLSDPRSLYLHFQNPESLILSGTSSSLFEYIDHSKAGKVPPRSLRPLFKQICTALYYLHEKNIIHGDLKEENILIGSVKGRLVAKLCDFGHSCKVDTCNPRMRLYGTRVLTPPELLNHLHADEKGLPCMEPLQTGFEQDIWALGIVFWTMLHGALPAENERYIRGDFDLDEFVYYPSSFAAINDPDCLDLLQNMLRIDPKTRLSALQVVSHPYFQ